jgi:hypothetical protein
MENIPEEEHAIPSSWGFTYFRFSKDFAIPSEHLKNHVYNQCLYAIPLHKGVTITLIVLLLICFNEQDQVPCNTFILFFPHHF